jgi:hypothetical protein
MNSCGSSGRFSDNNGQLEEVRRAYEKWLFRCSEDVYKAADSHRACSELLSYQLSLLYREWFTGIKDKVPVRQLKKYISEDARKAVDWARFQSTFLRPLGGSLVGDAGSSGANGTEAGQRKEQLEGPVRDSKSATAQLNDHRLLFCQPLATRHYIDDFAEGVDRWRRAWGDFSAASASHDSHNNFLLRCARPTMRVPASSRNVPGISL